MNEELKIGTVFKRIIPNMETLKGETKYFKIVSIRTKKEFKFLDEIYDISGFKIVEMKFEKVSSSVMAVNAESKETKIQDTYKLKETNDKPIYYKYSYMQWKQNYSGGLNQILTEEEQTKYVDRV